MVPEFKSGGFLFSIQYGYAVWDPNTARIGQSTEASDPGSMARINTHLKSKPAHALTLGLAYNLLGHVSIGADITASGWDVFSPGRGGGGAVVGKVAWHPLQAVFAAMKEDRKFGFDFNTFFGVGYGICGFGSGADNDKRGMDGLLFEWGLNADYFLARYFAIGIYVKGIFTSWDKYYIDFENRADPGNTITLHPVSGGAIWSFGLTLTFRGGE